MNLKKILPILLLLTSFNFYAQSEKMKEKKEQVRALKIAFLTTELEMTTTESEKFWPIYNRFDDKQFEIRHQKMRAYMSRMGDDALNSMSDKDARLLLTQIETTDEELFLLRKKFVRDIKPVLPAVKILKLKKAEEDFNRKLLHQYRNRTPKKE
ncbi:sensor of ECF-type sigma factor [Flavobacterium acetivorans]|uniref:sensor of ECF-type sigma factor n=1 Tax=Flavobacterium acetivorans TaxID=2893883 RepID=UPI001E351EFC|nr:sensor of ECF-type sigma factor [Flavobacterium sp. F-29]UFH34254.1 sensor of ECF-type sigma factor [Flavobacterium sp. F-29]